MDMRTLAEQVRLAFESSDLTLAGLVAKAGLDIEACSLSRKLHGKQVMTTEECEKCLGALRALATYDGRRAKKAA